MDEIIEQATELKNRADEVYLMAKFYCTTPAEFAAWLDEKLLARDPQVPLANLFELIEEF